VPCTLNECKGLSRYDFLWEKHPKKKSTWPSASQPSYLFAKLIHIQLELQQTNELEKNKLTPKPTN
jgi:hypothetical protein